MAQPPRTDAEWSALGSEILASIDSSSTSSTIKYPVPTTAPEIAQYIDHTLLKLDATPEQIDKLCEEAVQYGFKLLSLLSHLRTKTPSQSVCVRLPYVSRCASNLSASSPSTTTNTARPLIACVIGFHEGTHATASKVTEASSAVLAGAHELDMVLNHALIRAGSYSAAYHDVLAVREAAKPETVLKVILETSQLNREEVVIASAVALVAGADFVKTSTGFNGRGATVQDVRVMRGVVEVMAARGEGRGKGKGKVKASGGVRSREDALKMVEAGAERIGASSGVAIVSGMVGDAGY